jgi:carbon-monoxide dehydrogenase medium subunit
MIRERFAYHAPGSLEEAVSLLAGVAERAEVIGGGTWVVPEMVRGQRRPACVIDLRRAGLAGVRVADGEVAIGPCTTYAQLERADEAPQLLRRMAHGITGGPQIRNQGTIGGSACYANPASDVPAALLALGARLRLRSARGERELDAGTFFSGAFACGRSGDEILCAISVPGDRPGWRYGYEKFKLSAGSWPIVTAACAMDEGGVVRCLAIGGACAVPVAVADVGDGEIERAVAAALGEPWSDALAPGEYRRQIAPVIARRAVLSARNESEQAQRSESEEGER